MEECLAMTSEVNYDALENKAWGERTDVQLVGIALNGFCFKLFIYFNHTGGTCGIHQVVAVLPVHVLVEVAHHTLAACKSELHVVSALDEWHHGGKDNAHLGLLGLCRKSESIGYFRFSLLGGCQCRCRLAKMRDDSPFLSFRSLCLVVVTCVHHHLAVVCFIYIAAAGTWYAGNGHSLHLGHGVELRTVPGGIAYMRLSHNAVPLAVGHHLIITICKQRVALEATFHTVGIFVSLCVAHFSQVAVHGERVIHVV